MLYIFIALPILDGSNRKGAVDFVIGFTVRFVHLIYFSAAHLILFLSLSLQFISLQFLLLFYFITSLLQ